MSFSNSEKEAFKKKNIVLVTSIFTFSHNVFYSICNEVQLLSHICCLQMLSIWSSVKFRLLVKYKLYWAILGFKNPNNKAFSKHQKK